MNQQTATIETSKLNFQDWQAIARAVNNSDRWGLYKWLENYSQIKDLSIDEWVAIAESLGFNPHWGCKKYAEYRYEAISQLIDAP